MKTYCGKYKFWKETTWVIIICGILFMFLWVWIERSQSDYPYFFDTMVKFSKILVSWVIPLIFICILPIIFVNSKYRNILVVLLSFLIIIEFFYYCTYYFRFINVDLFDLKLYYIIFLILCIVVSNQFVLKYENIIKDSDSLAQKLILYKGINIKKILLPSRYNIYAIIYICCFMIWGGYFICYFFESINNLKSYSTNYHFVFQINILKNFFIFFFIFCGLDFTISFFSKNKNIFSFNDIRKLFLIWVLLETLIILPFHKFYISLLKWIGMY